jgi:Zn-dependent M28 family amino/carboxypeptidase
MGAAGLFYIYDEPMANPNGDVLESFICGMISAAAADTILASKGITSSGLRRSLLDEKKPDSFDLKWRARFSATVSHHPEGVGYNVAAVLEGSDPELKAECVILGAHLDHCGEHMGMVFPGAQDNASGSAVVMGIAEAFSRLDEKPARSVVFVLFGAEEMGLIGSYDFADYAALHYDKIDAMLNFDMVGEGDGINCGVTVVPEGLKDTLLKADESVSTLARTWDITSVGVRSSDFAPFFLKGAACAALFSNGPHLHYHKPEDTIYRINPDMMADAARLGFLAALMRAER